MSGWPHGNGGYQQLELAVPLPAEEDRMYPSLQERESRILSPPMDAPGTVVSPSAPIVQHSSASGHFSALPLARPAVEQKNNYNYNHNQQAIMLPRPNSAGYVPVPNEPGQPQPGALGILPPPVVSSQFASVSGSPAQPQLQSQSQPQPQPGDRSHNTPTIEDLRERVNNLQRSDFSIHSVFTSAWRFFTRNFCSYLGGQFLVFIVLVLLLILWSYVMRTAFHNHFHDYRFALAVIGIFVGGGWLFIFPMLFALTFATLRAIQLNRYLSVGDAYRFFTTKYCSFLFFSFIYALLFFPIFSMFSVLLSFTLFLFFSFTLPLKYQFPDLGSLKAMGLSARISRKNFCKMFLLTILIFVLNGIALLAFGVGLFVTIPMTMSIYAYLYHKLVGLHSMSGYTYVEGRADEYAYDGTGVDPDIAARHLAAPVQYIQLIPIQTMQTMRQMPMPMPMPMAMPIAPAAATRMVAQPPHPMMVAYPADAAQRV